jgi:hypothetical protein
MFNKTQQLALKHLQDINNKIIELKKMGGVLQQLADQCGGDDSPECPILDGLAQLSAE